MVDWQTIPGGVTAPRGYKAAGITAGLKPSGLPDLALILSDVDAIAAGVFTTSQVKAACVDYCRQRLLSKQSARAILCNAGQANAATGTQGWFDALESAMMLGQALNIPSESVLLASTGVIGKRIPMEQLKAGIPQLIAALSESGSDAAAGAIITTDLVTKSIALETNIGDRPVRIGGIAKGSGMIHPNMATMLAFVTCDAAVSPALWQQMLSRAADKSFNSITVDGDTSTNDSLIAFANGESRTPAITEMGVEATKLEAMLTAVCQHLAKAIARDGEGATCLIEVQVTGAPDEQSARQIAKTIAGSSLVKSAIFGRDPNWGRIAAAAGRAGVPFEQESLKIQLGNFLLMENGQPLSFDRAAASAYLRQAAEEHLPKDITATNMSNDLLVDRSSVKTQRLDNPVIIAVSIGNGHGSGKAWGCDLSYDYVKINAEYTT
ncbi:bifunctional ornithine acetyltransferase/N-acetylglutamate synthase [Aetokthonos hydrillicola Thurmond2011]|jgi:glutamate N-acetyltransferase/amino-acid N-acetyltransferase|uniref:Arginine biosynthesis bifunctional protein ArgJ n=1 Tax=Aetokthonos hydrillicola Thurmond2011 TaxID=2712845 RepID=A0AAP5I7E9_9CYAN|nr:bifunctional ornithine acetyltransferase/N-acetylglutamate synthase [Aetokthonos hydrillicola]MBO3459994.1 bifunctional ornithine acetyltransferase/N-acetylglutamate synthase [Aetokthonos hydrillicola CCALA 1050]MBW4584591.1 bifunctional ornithine acetyltransferase/N-acetylglutamate synthase [Aetokthonos hydrillicola CCALA 1050]MDR9895134.1 bifunctional ornithine acetyltransferase/N-acetylglutamate synthase [Aetokthonos hydrillicola Thurmond2011]